MKKVLASMVVVVLTLGLLAGCSGGAKDQKSEPAKEQKPVKELKMSVITSDTSAWYKAGLKFSNLVKERTNGQVLITVFPNGQLAGGNQVKELEMLQNGAIDFTFHSTILYTNIDPKFTVVSMPWLFNSTAEVDKFTRGDLGKELLSVLPAKGIIGLAWGENGFRQLTNSKRPVVAPEDMKGLKVRIPGIKMYTSIFTALGANPTVMNWGEVLGALQQGVIDGQENPLDVIVSGKIPEVQKHITLWNYSYDALILGMSKKAWDGFDAQTQQIIKKAAEEAADYEVKLNRENDSSNLKKIEEKLKVARLTPEQVAKFREKVAQVYSEYESVIGKDLLEKFRAVGSGK